MSRLESRPGPLAVELSPEHHAATRALLSDQVSRTARRRRARRRLAPVGIGLATVAAIGTAQVVVSGTGGQLVTAVRAAAAGWDEDAIDPSRCLPSDPTLLDALRYLPDPSRPAALAVRGAGFRPQQNCDGYDLPGTSSGTLVFSAAELAADGALLAGITVTRDVAPAPAPEPGEAEPSFPGQRPAQALTVREAPARLTLLPYQVQLSWTDVDDVMWRADAPTGEAEPGAQAAAIASSLVETVDSLSIEQSTVTWGDISASWTVLQGEPAAVADTAEDPYRNAWQVELGDESAEAADGSIGGDQVKLEVGREVAEWQRCAGSGSLGYTWIVAVGDGFGCLGDNGGGAFGGLEFEVAPGINGSMFGMVDGSYQGLPALAESLVPVSATDPRIAQGGSDDNP